MIYLIIIILPAKENSVAPRKSSEKTKGGMLGWHFVQRLGEGTYLRAQACGRASFNIVQGFNRVERDA